MPASRMRIQNLAQEQDLFRLYHGKTDEARVMAREVILARSVSRGRNGTRCCQE